jgi:hypothetical protein
MKDAGAGLAGLKGSEFLLMDDWIGLGRSPGFNFYERSQKLIDIWTKEKTEIEDKKEWSELITKMDADLNDIINAFEEFDKVQGSIEFKNEYRIKLISIQYRLWRLAIKEKLIGSNVMPHLRVPSIRGRFSND